MLYEVITDLHREESVPLFTGRFYRGDRQRYGVSIPQLGPCQLEEVFASVECLGHPAAAVALNLGKDAQGLYGRRLALPSQPQ